MAKILVVEDDELTNETVSEYFRDMEHTVVSVFDGETAVESLFI